MDYSPLYLSIKLSAISTVILMCVATPISWVLARRQFPGKLLVESLAGLPLVLPPTVLGFYLLMIMGPQGLGDFWRSMTGSTLVFTFAGIVIAACLHSLPFAMQPLKSTFEKLDGRLLESAYVLGCSPFEAFFKVVLPNTVGGLVAAAILAFAHTMGEFGVILMVGGSIPGKTKVASIAIYEAVESLQYDVAWKLSLALLILSYLILVIMNAIKGS